MTFLDQTVLDGHLRCQQHEVSTERNNYRQCCRDDGHVGQCELGSWLLLPRSAERLVKRIDECEDRS